MENKVAVCIKCGGIIAIKDIKKDEIFEIDLTNVPLYTKEHSNCGDPFILTLEDVKLALLRLSRKE